MALCRLAGCNKEAKIFEKDIPSICFCCDEHMRIWWESAIDGLSKVTEDDRIAKAIENKRN